MAMAAGKDLKSILTKLQYSDDAKVVQQITAQMKRRCRPVGFASSGSRW